MNRSPTVESETAGPGSAAPAGPALSGPARSGPSLSSGVCPVIAEDDQFTIIDGETASVVPCATTREVHRYKPCAAGKTTKGV